MSIRIESVTVSVPALTSAQREELFKSPLVRQINGPYGDGRLRVQFKPSPGSTELIDSLECYELAEDAVG